MTRIVPRSPSVTARSVSLEMLEPTQLCTSWSRFSLTVYSLKRAHASAASTSRTSILIRPCRTLNMSGSKSWTFWKNSSTNTTWLVGTKMVVCTLKSFRAAMAFLRLVYFQTTSFNLASWSRATTNQRQHQDYGTTNGAPFNSASSWMTLVSNMLGSNTSITSWIFSKKSRSSI